MLNQAAVVVLRGPNYSLMSDDPLVVAVVADLLATRAQVVASDHCRRRRSPMSEVGPVVDRVHEESTCT